MGKSSFDRVLGHLQGQGEKTPAPEDLRDDVETLVRRCDEVRSLDRAYGSVELSPFMKSLLRVTGMGTRQRAAAPEALRAVAGV